MVYWYIGVASFPNKDRELLEVLQPLRAVVLRICDCEPEAEAAHSDQLECAGALRCRAVIGAALQGKMPLSRANFVRAALGSGSAAYGPVRGAGTRRGRLEELNYLAAKK